MTTLRPSPAITVSDHTSIGETIQTLIDHKVGSVIVTSYSPPHQPVGIFTERDLLKWVFDFKDSNLWSVAIGTIMTKKLITLSLLDLDQANDVMLKNNIRHLPIIYNDENGDQQLAGIITMRDAFRALVEEKESWLKQQANVAQHKRVSLLAKASKDQDLQNKILSNRADLQIIEDDFSQELLTGKLLPQVLASDIFIFDIDHLSIQFWPIFLRKILDESKHPDVFLVYHPSLHEKKNIEAIKMIAAGKAVHAFSKPLNLLQYLFEIETSLLNH